MSTPPEALAALRARAEQLAAASPLTDTDGLMSVPQLRQELHIQRLERALQHEQLLQAQADAEASRLRYRDLYEFAPVGYATLAPDGTLTELNQCLTQLLGEERAQLQSRQLTQFVALADRPRFAGFLTGLWQVPTERHTCELTVCRVNGTTFFAELAGQAALPYEAAGAPASCRLLLRDVTARRRAADQLAASEARFRATFEQSRDGMVLLDGLRFADANGAALRLLGYADKDAVVGHAVAGFWPERQPDGSLSLNLLTDCLERAAATGWCRLEWQRPGPDGHPRWDELSFNPVLVQGRPLLHAAWRDITERKRAEQHLEASKARLQRALTAGSTGVWSWDLASGQVEADARAQAIFGLATSPVAFADLQARIHPADLTPVADRLTQALDTGTPFELEHRLLLPPDGQVRYVTAHGQFEYGPTGEAECMAGLVRDVTARQQARQQLNDRNLLLHNLLHNLPMLLGRLDADGYIREHIGQGLNRLGLRQNELVGRRAADVAPANAEHFRRLLAGESVSYVSRMMGTAGPATMQVSGFFNHEQQEAVLFGLDITEAEALKEEAIRQRLRQQQELHAVILSTQEEERRRIAESLHNGVGQLLYATRLHLDRLPPSEAAQASQQLLSEAIRATRDISFELTPSIVEHFGLATALRELVRRVPAGALTIHLHLRALDEPLPPRLPTAVYRIAQELLNNVMKHAQAREVFMSVSREANSLNLTLEDDGVGFDPGMVATQGIGLAGIRTRLELLGGTFELQSRPGQGTNVVLQLPLGEGDGS